MNRYKVTFYDLSIWVTEGDDSLYIRRKCKEYYPNNFVISVIQLPN